jgi:hypothetical protein
VYKWLTPDNAPSGTFCIELFLPMGEEWEAIVRGALAPLFDPDNFEQFGSVSADDSAAYFRDSTLDTLELWSLCE